MGVFLAIYHGVECMQVSIGVDIQHAERLRGGAAIAVSERNFDALPDLAAGPSLNEV